MTRQTFAQVSRCSAAPSRTGNPRITRDDLQSLRTVSQKKAGGVARFVNSFVKNMQSLYFQLMAGRPETNRMCKNYGHVIRGNWSGYLPCCADCGARINSPDELRKALPCQV